MQSLPRILGFTIIGLCAGLIICIPACGDHLFVSGNVSGTWAADTVFVRGTINIPSSQTLTIQPGVEVIFQGYYPFFIYGQLLALGTPGDSIRFTTTNPAAGWHGLRFLNAATGNRLDYCRFRYGRALGTGEDSYGGAIFCSNSQLEIYHCSFNSNFATHSGGAIWGAAGSSLMVNGCTIAGNTSGVFGSGIGFWSSINPLVEDCLIYDNAAGDDGGGVFCYGSDILINRCTIWGNSAVEWGGGICIGWDSNAEITGGLLVGNTGGDGGGLYLFDSEVIAQNCLFSLNRAAGGGGVYTHNDGGGIFLGYSQPSHLTLSDCLLAENSARRHGGGLSNNTNCSVNVSNCRFHGNEANQRGGGIALIGSSVSAFKQCLVDANSAGRTGGGFFCYNYGATSIRQCTIAANFAGIRGGGIETVNNLIAPISTCILWSNDPDQVHYITAPQINYSDVMNGWLGAGNISLNPAFVDTLQNDYRLAWGSPCIDTGDPNPSYHDPDSTRSDMGAFYYDQNEPVRVLLSPLEVPNLIPENGGSLNYILRVNNTDSVVHNATIWCELTLPDSSIYGPVLGPTAITVPGSTNLSSIRTQVVPASAPSGIYHTNAYAVVNSDTSSDSFMWGKLGATVDGSADWINLGADLISKIAVPPLKDRIPYSLFLVTCFPNPFNATTAISYKLQASSSVSLKVYDTAGRLIETLLNGWREAGTHELIFEARDLPSGVYFCKLLAGNFSSVQKLVLMK